MQYIPAIYPSMQVVYHIALQKKRHALGTYMRKHQAKKTQFQEFTAKRAHISALARRTIHLRSKGKTLPTSLKDIPVVHMAAEEPAKPGDSSCQTDASFFHRCHISVQFPSPMTSSRSLFTMIQKELVRSTDVKTRKVSKPARDLVSNADLEEPMTAHVDDNELKSPDGHLLEMGDTHEPQVLPELSISDMAQELGQENVDALQPETTASPNQQQVTRSPLQVMSVETNQVSNEDHQKWFGFCAGMVTHFG